MFIKKSCRRYKDGRAHFTYENREGQSALCHQNRAQESEGQSCFWASWCIAWIDPSYIEPKMYECLKREHEHPSGMVAPFAAEEALGKLIAFQLKDKEN